MGVKGNYPKESSPTIAQGMIYVWCELISRFSFSSAIEHAAELSFRSAAAAEWHF
jgi:hypothetical protein